MEGWISLHRKLMKNKIFSSEKGLKIWVWCILKASHDDREDLIGYSDIQLKQGQFIFGRTSASKELKIKSGTLWKWMLYLKSNNYIDINSTNKYSIVTIINWKQYQVKEQQKEQQIDNKVTTKEQQSDTNNNVNNGNKLLSKDSNVHEPVRVKKTRDMDIDYLITSYEKNFGFKPTDRKVRQVAYTFKRQINKLLGDLKEVRPELTFHDVSDLSFGWYMKREEKHGETMDVVRRKVTSILFDRTRKKYLEGGETT